MIEDLLGEASWPAAILAAVIAIVVGYSMQQDRADRHELRLAVVHECAHAESPATCADAVRQALKASGS